jgi:hypothetical protein
MDSKPLSAYWCARHWQPYVDNPAAQAIANNAVPRYVCSWRPFVDAVNGLCRDNGIGAANARTIVVREWTLQAGRPMCCIVGDEVMESIRREAFDGQAVE